MTNWEDDGVGVAILEEQWGVWEYWFKVVTEFAEDDEPICKMEEVHSKEILQGLQWSYLVVTEAAPSSDVPGVMEFLI